MQRTLRLHFVTVQQTHGKDETAATQRDIELADSDARSHAARVGHQTKKAASRPKRTIPWDNGGRFKAGQHLHMRKDPWQTTAYVSSCLLDPFVKLPVDLTLDERNLLHEYLAVVPKAMYHTTGASAFCPVRDTTLPSIATNEIWLSWAVLCMQRRRAELQGLDTEKDQMLLHRKRVTYKLMNEKLNAQTEEVLSDDTLYGIVVSGVAEHRVSGPEMAKKHLEAGLMLFEMRQKRGLSQRITYPTGLVLVNGYIGIGVDNFFKHYVTLMTTGSSVLRRLKAMHTWNREVRQCVSMSSGKETVGDKKPVLGYPSSEFMAARAALAAKDSIVRGHVRRMLGQRSEADTRTCLGALFAMNTVLWASRDNECESMEYIKELLYYLTMSEPGPVVNGTPQLTNLAAMYIIGFCGSNMQSRYGTSRTRFDLWDVVRFIELMMLADEQSRETMKDALASWLLEDLDKPECLFLWADRDSERMINEVEAAWMQKQSSLKQESDLAAAHASMATAGNSEFSRYQHRL